MTNDLQDFFKTEEIFETEMIENFEKTLGNVFETEFDWRMLIETFSRKTCCQDQVSRMDLLPLISDIRSAVAGILKQSSLNGNRLVLVQTELQVFMKCIFRNELDVVFQKSFINIVSLTAVDPHVCSRLIKALMSDITSNQIKKTFPYLIDKGVFVQVNEDKKDGVLAVFKIPNDSFIVPMISLGFRFFHRSFAFLTGTRTRSSLKNECSYPTFDLLVEVLGITSRVAVPDEFTFELFKDQATALDGVTCVLSESIQSFQITSKHLLGLLRGSNVGGVQKSNFVFNTVHGGEIAIDDEKTQWKTLMEHKCSLSQHKDVLALKLVTVDQKIPKNRFHGIRMYKGLYFLPIPRVRVFHRKRMSHTVVNLPLVDFSLADWGVDGDVLKYFEPIAVLLNNLILHEHCKGGRWHIQAYSKINSFKPDLIEYSLESNRFAIISADQRYFNEPMIKQLSTANVLFRTMGESMFFIAPLLHETKSQHISNGIRASDTKLEHGNRMSSLTFTVPNSVTFENFSLIGTLSHHTSCRVIDLSTEKIAKHLIDQISSQPHVRNDEKETVSHRKRDILGMKFHRRFLLKENERIVSIGDKVWKKFNKHVSNAASKAMMLAKISEFQALDMFVVFTILRLSQLFAQPGERCSLAKRCFMQLFQQASNKNQRTRSRCMTLFQEFSRTIDELDHSINWSRLVENLSFVRSHVNMFSFFKRSENQLMASREEFRQELINMRMLFEFLFRNETKMKDELIAEFSSDPKTKEISVHMTMLKFKSNFVADDMLTFSNAKRIESDMQLMINVVSTRQDKLFSFSESLINSLKRAKTLIKLRFVVDELDHQYLLIFHDETNTILIRCFLSETVPKTTTGVILVLSKKIFIDDDVNAQYVSMKENVTPLVESSVSKFHINLEMGIHGF